MQALIDRINAEGEYVGDGIVKLDGFLNHQVDAELTWKMGEEFIKRFEAAGIKEVTKIISAEVSGIPSALATAHLLKVPMIYARKHRSAVMTDVYYFAQTRSRTKNEDVHLMISKKYLGKDDRVIIIDDFLATGSTLNALSKVVVESDATLCAIGCVIEKPAEGGLEKLAHLNVPIETLAKIEISNDELIVS